jgi:hypothetical protein
MTADPIPVRVGELDVPPLAVSEGEIVVDVVVIARTVNPNRSTPAIAVSHTEGLQDYATLVGLLTGVNDHVRGLLAVTWGQV